VLETVAVDVSRVRPLRREVLRPGASPDELAYPLDDALTTLHVAVLADANEPLAIGSVMPDAHPRDPVAGDWRIRGMATRPGERSRGLGAAVLACLERYARERGGRRLWCNARVGARAFYERAGMTAEDELFEIERIGPHYLMSKRLT
jgi:GNAT superfamily N-acetyltransferase